MGWFTPYLHLADTLLHLVYSPFQPSSHSPNTRLVMRSTLRLVTWVKRAWKEYSSTHSDGIFKCCHPQHILRHSFCGSGIKGSEVQTSWNVMAHGDAQEGKWKGNCQMEWVASTLRTTSEHGVSADVHTSAASSRLNWHNRQFKWTRLFCQKTKSGFCACAITFQTQSTTVWQFMVLRVKIKIILTLILLTWRIWWAPNNACKWQMGFNSAFKGLSKHVQLIENEHQCLRAVSQLYIVRTKAYGEGDANCPSQ